MSLFKKLFGDRNNKRPSGHPDIKSLLASPDINKSIIELDNYICKVCDWGDDLSKITDQQKSFYFNQNLEREINNGGFNQFFFNSSGDFAHETIISLQIIGANKTASILQEAINEFPNAIVPKERNERKIALNQIEGKSNEVWEQLDQKFFAYEDNLNDLNIRYVKSNQFAF